MTNNIQKYNITISPKNNSSQQDIINEIVTNYANSFNLLSIQITATIIRIFVSNSVQYYDVTVKITTPSDITPPNTDQFISASNNTPTTYTPYPKSVVNIWKYIYKYNGLFIMLFVFSNVQNCYIILYFITIEFWFGYNFIFKNNWYYTSYISIIIWLFIIMFMV